MKTPMGHRWSPIQLIESLLILVMMIATSSNRRSLSENNDMVEDGKIIMLHVWHTI